MMVKVVGGGEGKEEEGQDSGIRRRDGNASELSFHKFTASSTDASDWGEVRDCYSRLFANYAKSGCLFRPGRYGSVIVHSRKHVGAEALSGESPKREFDARHDAPRYRFTTNDFHSSPLCLNATDDDAFSRHAKSKLR